MGRRQLPDEFLLNSVDNQLIVDLNHAVDVTQSFLSHLFFVPAFDTTLHRHATLACVESKRFFLQVRVLLNGQLKLIFDGV